MSIGAWTSALYLAVAAYRAYTLWGLERWDIVALASLLWLPLLWRKGSKP